MRADTPKTLEQLSEQLLETKLEMAFILWNEEEAAQLENESAMPDNNVSEIDYQRHYSQFLKLLDQRMHNERKRHFLRQTLPQMGRGVAVALLILLLTFTTALALSPTARAFIMKLFFHSEYTEIRLDENEVSSSAVSEGWPLRLYPRYLPDGYALHAITDMGNFLIAEFTDSAGELRIMLFEDDENVVTNIDTEDALVSHIRARDTDVLYVKKGRTVTYVWIEEGRCYTLDVESSEADALKILEGLQKTN